MTPKEALNKIWSDTYLKSCETWSVDRLCEHWRVVEKALNELEELKRDVVWYFELANNDEITEEVLNEFSKIRNKLLKVGKQDE